jgi:hypothetical protein
MQPLVPLLAASLLSVPIAALLLAPISSHAFSDGAAVAGLSSSGCGGCHGSQATSTVGVSLSGSLTISPNDNEPYSLDIATGGVGGVFDVTLVGDGTLSTSESNAKVVSSGKDFVNGSSARPDNVGDWTYSFAVTIGDLAPGTELMLQAVGMQFDDPSGADSGDLWNFADTITLTVVPEPSVPTGSAWMLLVAILGASAVYARVRKRV